MDFVDPPARKKGRRSEKWNEIVRTLKENQGQWALVGNYSPGVATHIRRGEYPAFVDGVQGDETQRSLHMARHWEVTTRKTHDGKRNDVYIRYIG